MKRLAVHTLALALALSCLLACGGGKDKIIPRGKLSRIYEELYLADRWADLKTEYRSQADTTDFYETVLESYGYTSADYRASVEYYLNDPERFSRILKKTSARLTAKSKDLGESANRIQEILEMLERAKDTAPQYKSLTDISLDSLMRLVFDVPRYNVELPAEKTAPDSTLTGSDQADSTLTDSLKLRVAPVKGPQIPQETAVQPGTRRIAEQ